MLGLLAGLVMTAAACSSANAEPTALPQADTPEYGASLDEFLELSPDAAETTEYEAPVATPPPDGFREVTWEDLIPPGSSGAEISARFDERIAEVEPGSPEADEIFAELQAEYDNQPVNPELAGEDIQLAGFVAPLNYSGELITEFLLVPYFGACIHVPPPPVNQTVMVTLAEGEGLSIDDSWGAVWVVGTLTVDGADTDLATAGYTITGAQTGVYDQQY